MNVTWFVHEGGNSLKWLRREWRRDGRRCLSPCISWCLWHRCRTVSSLYMLCSCSKSGPERGTFPLGKAVSLLLLDTQAANNASFTKSSGFINVWTCNSFGRWSTPGRGGGCQIDTVYSDFKNLLEGRWLPFAEIGVCCPGKLPVYLQQLCKVCVCVVGLCVCMYMLVYAFISMLRLPASDLRAGFIPQLPQAPLFWLH